MKNFLIPLLLLCLPVARLASQIPNQNPSFSVFHANYIRTKLSSVGSMFWDGSDPYYLVPFEGD